MPDQSTCQRCGEPTPRGQKFCSRSCYFAALRGVPKSPFSDRFWSYVDTTGDCWIWHGYINEHGYGRLTRSGRLILAHRAVWELTHGAVPNGLFVLHNCDTPACVNPAHLWLGTRRDNTRDMVEKQRQQRGETNGNSRFSEDDIRAMRALVASGMMQIEVAALYGTIPNHISRIVNRLRWQHVD